MGQRILVTGGAGYIGSVLVPTLLKLGHHVTVLDSFMYRQTSLFALCGLQQFNVVRGDVRDHGIMRRLLAKADVIIPLAAIVGAPACARDPIAAWSVNTEAVRSLVRMLSNAQRILIPITNSGYGVGDPGVECTEDTPLRPISEYGKTKVEAEIAAFDHDNTIAFRLATVFGMSPRMRLDLLVNDFVWRAVNDGAIVLFEAHFKRNYIHVNDVARVFCHGLRHFHDMRGRAYNVGLSDANLSKLQLCQKIEQHVPGFTIVEAPIGEDPDKRDYIVSNARIEATNWVARHSLDAGIDELIKGYQMLRNGVHDNG